MNVAANIGAGTEALQAGTAIGNQVDGVAPHAGGSKAAWGRGNTQIASRLEDAKAGDPAQSFSGRESFRSSWQSMLRASGSGFGSSDEADVIGAGGEHREQAGSTTQKGATPPGNVAMPRRAGKIAKQNGQHDIAAARSAIDTLQNTVSARRNSGWVEAQAVVNATSQTVSAKDGRSLHGAHGDRYLASIKPDGGAKKFAAGTQSVAAGSAPSADASMAVVPAPALNVAQGQVAQTEQRSAAASGNSDALPGLAQGWEKGLDTPVEREPTAAGTGTGAPPTPTAGREGERVHTSSQAAQGSVAGPVRTELHEEDASAAFGIVSGARATKIRSERIPSPEPEPAIAGDGQKNPVQGSHRAENDTAIPHATVAPDAGNNLHRGGSENTVGTIQTPSSMADADRLNADGSRIDSGTGAIEDKVKPETRAARPAQSSKQGIERFGEHPVDAAGSMVTPVQGTAGTHPSVGMRAGSAAQSSGAVAAPKETFAELDAGTTVGAPRWVHAADRQVEAGFEDPGLGWVGVKADLNGGSVHAVLVPSTAAAAEVLGAHMAGLSSHLAEQRAQVSTLTLADSGVSSGGTAQNMQQGAGQDGDSGGSANTQWSQQAGSSAGLDSQQEQSAVHGGVIEAILAPSGIRGAHISVMA